MNETSTQKKSAMPAILCVLLVCSILLSCVTMISGLQTKKSVVELKEAVGKEVDTGEEDDVTIFDEYVIRSTKHISDAYLNGTEDTLDDRDKETLSMAKNVLKEIIKDDMTDYEKEEAVYLWLTKEMKNDTSMLTVIHESNTDVDNPYGVLKNRNAVCVGYATTMRLLLQMMGIECKVIHSSDLIHSWDLVCLDDEWYHVDCYSDADGALYRNFNLNDELAEENHDWNHEFFPAATGTKYSYASQHAVEIKNIYAIPKWVNGLLKDEASIGACTFKQKITPDTEASAAVMITKLEEALQSLEEFSEKYYFDHAWSKTADGDYVLTFNIMNYGEDEPEVDDDELAKIESSITKVFEDVEFYHDDEGYDDSYEDYDDSENVDVTEAVNPGDDIAG